MCRHFWGKFSILKTVTAASTKYQRTCQSTPWHTLEIVPLLTVPGTHNSMIQSVVSIICFYYYSNIIMMLPGTCELIKNINGPIKWYFDWQLIVRFSLLTQLCPLPRHSELEICILFPAFILFIFAYFCILFPEKFWNPVFKVTQRFLGLGDFVQRVLVFYSKSKVFSDYWLLSFEAAWSVWLCYLF